MLETSPGLYKRDQVERAIAAYSGRVSNAQHRPDPLLKANLKRLLDTDRKEGTQAKKGARSRYAFFDGDPPGKGVDQVYGFETTFALLVAERLLRAGLTQQRAVFRLRAARSALDQTIQQILASPSAKSSAPTARRSALPPKPEKAEMIFWVTTGGPGADLELRPEIFCQAQSVAEHLSKAAQELDPVIVLELVAPILGLRHWLSRMPIRKRGRS